MDYFKPKQYYYIIPILRIDKNIILNNNKSLYDFINENFPILRSLDNEKAEILYSGNVPDYLNSDYLKQKQLIIDALRYLNLPEHILAVGKGDCIIEPVTGIRITEKVKDNITLQSYRVSDVDLENYFISNYEDKIKNFFFPDIFILEDASKDKEAFTSAVADNNEKINIKCKVNSVRELNRKKGMNKNDN